MKHRTFDAAHLDVSAFAADGAALSGAWPLASLPRLASGQMPGAEPVAPPPDVQWQARGELVPVRGGDPEVWLLLAAQAEVVLQCQRCLAPVATRLAIDRRLRFVRGEEQAAALDDELDDDVLALTRTLDLRELVEDELILASPLVPRHEACPDAPDLHFEADAAGPAEEGGREHPFAALAAWRKSGGSAG